MADIDSNDYFLLLSAEQLKAMTRAQAEAEFQRVTFVSDKMKAECEAELAEASLVQIQYDPPKFKPRENRCLTPDRRANRVGKFPR